MTEFSKYDEERLGVSLDYGDKGVTATVYLYNNGHDQIPIDPDHEPEIGEIRLAVDGLRYMEEQGRYKDVEVSTKADIDRFGTDTNHFTLVSLPATFRARENDDLSAPFAEAHKISLITVGVYRDHFIKLRYSFSSMLDEEASLATRDEFVDSLGTIIRESAIRLDVRRWLKTYEAAPLSEEGEEAAAKLFGYANDSKLIRVTISQEWQPWFEVEDYPHTPALLQAFVIGNMAKQWRSMQFRDAPYAGLKQALVIYEALQKTGQATPLPEIDELLRLEKAGELEQKMANAEPEAKRER